MLHSHLELKFLNHLLLLPILMSPLLRINKCAITKKDALIVIHKQLNQSSNLKDVMEIFALWGLMGEPKFSVNPLRTNPRRREKINLNFYFHTSSWCVKRFLKAFISIQLSEMHGAGRVNKHREHLKCENSFGTSNREKKFTCVTDIIYQKQLLRGVL